MVDLFFFPKAALILPQLIKHSDFSGKDLFTLLIVGFFSDLSNSLKNLLWLKLI